jgi:Domain of unknown function (DUF4412)
MTRRLLFPALSLLLLAAGPLLADDVLEIARTTGTRSADGQLLSSREERGTLYFGAGAARFDQGTNVTWILRRDQGVLFLVHHGAKTYEKLPLPVRFEDLLAEPQRSQLVAMLPAQPPTFTAQATEESRTLRGYPSRKFVIEAAPRENVSIRYDLWMTTDLPIDLSLYRDLVRSAGALDLQLRGAAAKLSDLPGFPMEREGVLKKGGREDFDHRSLLSVTKRDLPPSHYQPPAGYREIAFQASRWVELKPAEAVEVR